MSQGHSSVKFPGENDSVVDSSHDRVPYGTNLEAIRTPKELLMKPTELMQLTLCGNPLLWVVKIVQLGMTVTNKSCKYYEN